MKSMLLLGKYRIRGLIIKCGVGEVIKVGGLESKFFDEHEELSGKSFDVHRSTCLKVL
jgi:hypothetical protein